MPQTACWVNFSIWSISCRVVYIGAYVRMVWLHRALLLETDPSFHFSLLIASLALLWFQLLPQHRILRALSVIVGTSSFAHLCRSTTDLNDLDGGILDSLVADGKLGSLNWESRECFSNRVTLVTLRTRSNYFGSGCCVG